MTPFELLAKLERLNVKISLTGGKLRLVAPAGTLTLELKEAVRRHKAELVALLSGRPVEVVFWPGVASKVYRVGQACLEAGHCLWLTNNCDLFPLTWCWGWCRERVGMRQTARGLDLASSDRRQILQ